MVFGVPCTLSPRVPAENRLNMHEKYKEGDTCTARTCLSECTSPTLIVQGAHIRHDNHPRVWEVAVSERTLERISWHETRPVVGGAGSGRLGIGRRHARTRTVRVEHAREGRAECRPEHTLLNHWELGRSKSDTGTGAFEHLDIAHAAEEEKPLSS